MTRNEKAAERPWERGEWAMAVLFLEFAATEYAKDGDADGVQRMKRRRGAALRRMRSAPANAPAASPEA